MGSYRAGPLGRPGAGGAPATANFMASLTAGPGGRAVEHAVSLPARRRSLLAPAMNQAMWQHPSVQAKPSRAGTARGPDPGARPTETRLAARMAPGPHGGARGYRRLGIRRASRPSARTRSRACARFITAGPHPGAHRPGALHHQQKPRARWVMPWRRAAQRAGSEVISCEWGRSPCPRPRGCPGGWDVENGRGNVRRASHQWIDDADIFHRLRRDFPTTNRNAPRDQKIKRTGQTMNLQTGAFRPTR